MNNTTHKLSHIKPGKLYQYTGAVFFCVFSEYIKNMNSIIKVCTNDIFMCLSIESREEYDSWNNLYYKKICIRLLYNNEIVYSSFAETSISENNIYVWFTPLT